MKKKTLIFAICFAFISFFDLGSSSFQNKATAQVGVEEVGKVLDAVVDLFCPETPQNRCKHGVCQTGACISFRKACPPDQLNKPCNAS
jgi:hypothetical protein